MTNEEKIQELLNEPCWESKPYLIGMDKAGVEDVMERFADWKDEQHKQEKQKLIDKAIEWFYLQLNDGNMECRNIETFISEFKKSMKGEY